MLGYSAWMRQWDDVWTSTCSTFDLIDRRRSPVRLQRSLTHDSLLSMKHRQLLAAVACAFTFAVNAQAQGGPPGGAPPANDKPTTPLGNQMRAINGAYRALGRLIEAGNKDSALVQVAIIHQAGEEALKYEPEKKADVPADEQAKFVAEYQASMKAFIADVEKVDAALKAGNMEDAKTATAALRMDQMNSHRQFRKPQPRPPGR